MNGEKCSAHELRCRSRLGTHGERVLQRGSEAESGQRHRRVTVGHHEISHKQGAPGKNRQTGFTGGLNPFRLRHGVGVVDRGRGMQSREVIDLDETPTKHTQYGSWAKRGREN